uniref:CCHC-type domain-containing protein n=1 Tax=Phlebotomus papatasi TaxID=29031 RepID=A0A1B0DJA3_PHLPP
MAFLKVKPFRKLKVVTFLKEFQQLADQNVIGVQRLKARENGQWINTSTHILTFKTPTCPAEVKVGYLTVKTEIYIPSPFRCVVCQRLGHTKKRCDSNKNKPRCAICGLEEPHGFFFPCYLPKCVNCSGAHPSYSKLCPRFIEEREVNAIRVSLRIPYNLAREELRKRKGPQTSPLLPTPTPGPSKASFSEIVANPTQTHSKSSDKPSRPQKTEFVPVNRSQTQSRVMPAEFPVQTLSSSIPTLSTPPITSSPPSVLWGDNYLPSPCPSPSGPDPDPPDIIVSDDESMPIDQNFNSH